MIAAQGAEAVARLGHEDAPGLFEQQFLIERLRLFGIVQALLVELAKVQQCVVHQDVQRIELEHFFQVGGGFGELVPRTGDAEALVEDIIPQAVHGEGPVQAVKYADGFRILVLEGEELSLCIEAQRHTVAVRAQVVADQQAQFHGVVGDQLRGTGLQYIELCERPQHVAGIERDLGVAQTRLVADHIVLEVQVHLREEEGGFPDIASEHMHIAEGELVGGLLLRVERGQGDRFLQESDGAGTVVEIVGLQSSVAFEQLRCSRSAPQFR